MDGMIGFQLLRPPRRALAVGEAGVNGPGEEGDIGVVGVSTRMVVEMDPMVDVVDGRRVRVLAGDKEGNGGEGVRDSALDVDVGVDNGEGVKEGPTRRPTRGAGGAE